MNVCAVRTLKADDFSRDAIVNWPLPHEKRENGFSLRQINIEGLHTEISECVHCGSLFPNLEEQ